MKLSEALMERKDLIKKINNIKEEITSNLVTRQGFQLPFDMDLLFADYKELQAMLESLNLRIDKANADHLTEKLNALRILDSIMIFYKQCRKTLLSEHSSMYREEPVYERNYDITRLNEEIELFEIERRKLDREIQSINWQTELE